MHRKQMPSAVKQLDFVKQVNWLPPIHLFVDCYTTANEKSPDMT